MKALLIADDENVISNTSEVLKTAGYEVIVYRWLLKALDNIEEISPHLIVISTEDYPRHWKIVTQFAASRFGSYIPQVILYTGKEFPEEEAKKAEVLKVRGTFSSVDVEGLEQLREILTKTIDIYSGKLTDSPISENFTSVTESLVGEDEDDSLQEQESESSTEDIQQEVTADAEETVEREIEEDIQQEEDKIEEIPQTEESEENEDDFPISAIEEDISAEASDSEESEISIEDSSLSEDEIKANEEISIPVPTTTETFIQCAFIFTNPQNGALVSGIARNYDGEKLEFTPDLPSLCANLSAGTKIEKASISSENSVSEVSAEVLDSADFITIQVKKSA